jgi:alkylhydroperoxidase family enzyme
MEGPLPVWARALAKTLPHTTAAMLELDHLHRARSPLDPKLRGQLRWVAARANRCKYGEAYALADLRVAGLDEAGIRALTGDQRGLPDDTRVVLAFARKLTAASDSVTDAEVARLIDRLGEKQVVAIVLLLAYANFQDCLLLALDLPVEAGGPLPPLDVRFARRSIGTSYAAPPRRRPERAATPAPEDLPDPDWASRDPADVRSGVAKQRARQPRLSLPADQAANRWGLVGQTYQPELATAWSACVQAFGEEADQDPVFEQSVFWVVTRTKRCFY